MPCEVHLTCNPSWKKHPAFQILNAMSQLELKNVILYLFDQIRDLNMRLAVKYRIHH